MFITTRLVLDMETMGVVSREGYAYVGPVDELKKGSDAAKSAAAGAGDVGTSAQNLSKSNQASQTGAQSTAAPFAKSLLPNANGGLSPYAQGQYTQAKVQNAQDAQNQRQMGAKAAALRGFNNSPGSTASIMNTAGQNQGRADTQAYQNAQQSTLGQGLDALNYYQGQQQIYNPNAPLQTATSAYGTQANAANVMNQSPTLAGDIGGGLMGLAGAAGKVMTGMGDLGVQV